MALIYRVIYPNGESADAVGYPGQILRVDIVPRGPEACLGDEVECEFGPAGDYIARVLRIVGGPRRPTLHVHVAGDEAARIAWMDARDAEGWDTRESRDDPSIVWIVATADGLDPASL